MIVISVLKSEPSLHFKLAAGYRNGTELDGAQSWVSSKVASSAGPARKSAGPEDKASSKGLWND